MIRRLALLSLLCSVAASIPALAQVRVQPGALDSLSPTTPSPATTPIPATPAPATPGAAAKATRSRPARVTRRPVKPEPAHRTPQAVNKPAGPPAPVAIAPGAPPVATVAPPPALPPPKPLPAPVIPMVSGAAGDVSSIAGGLRVTFGPGKAEMSPATVAALHSFAQAVAPNPSADVNIYAYAAGAPDDPSTPRRLSLSRALAARAVLMSDSIVSTRIYVHALGATASAGPPDRVDVQLAGTPQTPAPVPPPSPPPPSPAPGPTAPAPRKP